MPDANESRRKDMLQKAAQELICCNCHFALLVAVRIILPPESNVLPIEAQEPMIANGNAMGVARQVVQHMFRSAERRFCVNDPLLAVKRSDEACKMLGVR